LWENETVLQHCSLIVQFVIYLYSGQLFFEVRWGKQIKNSVASYFSLSFFKWIASLRRKCFRLKFNFNLQSFTIIVIFPFAPTNCKVYTFSGMMGKIYCVNIDLCGWKWRWWYALAVENLFLGCFVYFLNVLWNFEIVLRIFGMLLVFFECFWNALIIFGVFCGPFQCFEVNLVNILNYDKMWC